MYGYRIGDPCVPAIEDGILDNNDGGVWELGPPDLARHHERKPVCAFGPERVKGIVRPQVDPDDAVGIVLACAKRVSPKMPEMEDPEGLKNFADKFWKIFIPRMESSDIISFDDFVEQLDKPIEYKLLLKEAHQTRLKDFAIRGKRKTSSFIKDEDYDEWKHIRTIQGISKESLRADLNSYYARIIKSVEKIVYAHCPALVKHMTPEERLKFIQELGEAFYLSANDFSSYEASFTAEKMDTVQLSLYEYILAAIPGGSRMVDGIRDVITKKNILMFKKMGVKYSVEARKMSGDPDTALSNAIDNLVCICYLLYKRGVKPEHAVRMFFVEGDDNIGNYGSHSLDKKDFAKLGLIAKPVTPKDRTLLDDNAFCQLVGTDGGSVINANPWKKLAKMGRVSAKYMDSSDKTYRSLLRCEALSLLSLHHGAPVVHALAVKLLEITRGVNVRDKHLKEYEKWGMKLPDKSDWRQHISQKVSMDDRVLVERTFDMTVEMQLKIEEIIQQWKGGELKIPIEWFPQLWSQFSDEYVSHEKTQHHVHTQPESRKRRKVRKDVLSGASPQKGNRS